MTFRCLFAACYLQAKRIVSRISLLQDRAGGGRGIYHGARAGAADGGGFGGGGAARLKVAEAAKEEARQAFYVANQEFLTQRFVCSSSAPGAPET